MSHKIISFLCIILSASAVIAAQRPMVEQNEEVQAVKNFIASNTSFDVIEELKQIISYEYSIEQINAHRENGHIYLHLFKADSHKVACYISANYNRNKSNFCAVY